MSILDRQEKLEEKRLEALASQDALRYMILCNESGIEPEDEFLYQQGEAENIKKTHELALEKERAQRIFDGLEEQRDLERWASFYEESNSLLSGDSGRLYEARAQLLQDYFPRFRDDGNQPLYNGRGSRNYTPEALWGLLKNLNSSARKNIDKKLRK